MEIQEWSSMPVCAGNNRLYFITDVTLVLELPGHTLKRVELAGNSWDGASIPKPLWWLVGHPLSEEFRWPSFWHDRFCETSYTYSERYVADSVFLYLLSKSKVSKVKCFFMWFSCRVYAIFFWKLHCMIASWEKF
jgi:hypothetical protein